MKLLLNPEEFEIDTLNEEKENGDLMMRKNIKNTGRK